MEKDSRHNSVEEVKRYYETWTDPYIESFGDFFQALQTKNPKDYIKYFIKKTGIRKDMMLLDAGCGIGGPATTLASLIRVNIEGESAFLRNRLPLPRSRH
jgi:cyclopropane fatty-acyl-phospholipid synthase-like methyltransferase